MVQQLDGRLVLLCSITDRGVHRLGPFIPHRCKLQEAVVPRRSAVYHKTWLVRGEPERQTVPSFSWWKRGIL